MLLDIQIYWPSPTNWHFPDDSFYPTTPVRHLVIRTKFPDTNLSVALITTISQSEPQLPPNWSPRQTQKLALSQSQSQVIKLCASHSQMSHPTCLPVKPNLSLSLSRASSHAPRPSTGRLLSPESPSSLVCWWAPANPSLGSCPRNPAHPCPCYLSPSGLPAVPWASSAHGHARVPASGSRHQKASPITGSVVIPPLSPDEGASSYSLGRKEHSLHFHTPACLIPFTLLYSLQHFITTRYTHRKTHRCILLCIFYGLCQSPQWAGQLWCMGQICSPNSPPSQALIRTKEPHDFTCSLQQSGTVETSLLTKPFPTQCFTKLFANHAVLLSSVKQAAPSPAVLRVYLQMYWCIVQQAAGTWKPFVKWREGDRGENVKEKE